MAGVQLRQLGCVEGLINILNEHDVSPNDIEVEVTETGLLDTSAVSRENLVRMRNAGVRIALDDFESDFQAWRTCATCRFSAEDRSQLYRRMKATRAR